MGKLVQRLGAEVRARRKAKGLTQPQLAEAASISEEWVRRIERGEGSPSLDTVEVLARALEVSHGELLAGFSPSDARFEDLIAQASRMSAEELEWLADAARLVLRRPSKS